MDQYHQVIPEKMQDFVDFNKRNSHILQKAFLFLLKAKIHIKFQRVLFIKKHLVRKF